MSIKTYLFHSVFFIMLTTSASVQSLLGQQTMHNFTITDTDGIQHNLYNDHLNNGKTVVIKFFFTTCPPCIALAPWWQARNVAWGNNTHDTRFFEVTVLSSDNSTKVANYKTTYGLTVIGVGDDGGAQSIANPFKQGTYGSWWGTPSFAVIAPNGTLHYPVQTSELDAVIASTGAQMPGSNPVPDPTIVNLNIQSLGGNLPDGFVKFYMKPQNSSTPKLEIVKNAQGQYTFSYPSTNFPEMSDPVIVMESVGAAWNNLVSAADIVTIQKHILGLEPFQQNYKILAADVDGNDKVTAADLVTIRKLILTLITEFPNNVPSYKSIPAFQTVQTNPGNTVQVNMSVFKMGNVN